MASEVAKLTPRSDLSVRTALSRLETLFAEGEARTAVLLEGLAQGHSEMNGRLGDMSVDLTSVRLTVARIEGERTAEQREVALTRAHPKMTAARRAVTWSSIGAATVTIIAGIVAFGHAVLVYAVSAMVGH